MVCKTSTCTVTIEYELSHSKPENDCSIHIYQKTNILSKEKQYNYLYEKYTEAELKSNSN